MQLFTATAFHGGGVGLDRPVVKGYGYRSQISKTKRSQRHAFFQKLPSRCVFCLFGLFFWKIRCFLARFLGFVVIGGDFPKMVILRIFAYTEFSQRLRE